MTKRGKVYGFDAVFLGSPAPRAMLDAKVILGAVVKSQIGREHADVMPATSETAGERTDFENGATALLKWVIRLDCLQYSHASQVALALSSERSGDTAAAVNKNTMILSGLRGFWVYAMHSSSKPSRFASKTAN